MQRNFVPQGATMRRWAWRMLPHEYRFCLLCVHRLPRGDENRVEVAHWLRKIRKEK